jgi:murein DD-endopeptidase MepM/ murein hydrolase activator NlpD
MTHFFQRTALVLLATSALCAGPAAARTHHHRHHAAKPSPAPAPAPVAANGRIVTLPGERAAYVVKKGDTLDKIADKLDTSVAALKKGNRLKGNNLQPGDVLKGPPVTKKAYVVSKGDTVYSIAQRFHVSVEELRDENDLSAKVHIRPGQKIRLPADYKAPAVLAAQDEADNAGPAPKAAKGKKGKMPAPEAAAETPAAGAPAGPVGEPGAGAQGRIVKDPGHAAAYRVRRGDTLNKIADRLNTSADDLRRENHVRGNALRPGQTLRGPRTQGSTAYMAASGDSLGGVAARLGVSIEALKAANDLGGKTILRGGQKLKLPSGVHEETAAPARPEARYPRPAPPSRDDSTLPSRPQPYSGSASGPIQTQRPYVPPAGSATSGPAATPTQGAAPSDAQIAQLGKGRFQWPLKGELLSDFGAKPGGQRNDGINIQAEAGASVRAAADGDVVYAGDQVPGFGNLVLIKHADGWVTAYGHLGRVEVKMQQKVMQGQQIGQAGQTGGVPEPQLHFEVRYAPNPLAGDRARPVDPKLVLPK